MYLWLDLWDKRVWIAVYIEGIIVPKDIVPRTKIIKILQKYIEEYNIELVVVWLPFDLYWKDRRQLEKTEKFIEKLKNIFPYIKVEAIDERFTSFEAENILKEAWEQSTDFKKDAIAASLILESYLNNFNK